MEVPAPDGLIRPSRSCSQSYHKAYPANLARGNAKQVRHRYRYRCRGGGRTERRPAHTTPPISQSATSRHRQHPCSTPPCQIARRFGIGTISSSTHGDSLCRLTRDSAEERPLQPIRRGCATDLLQGQQILTFSICQLVIYARFQQLWNRALLDSGATSLIPPAAPAGNALRSG